MHQTFCAIGDLQTAIAGVDDKKTREKLAEELRRILFWLGREFIPVYNEGVEGEKHFPPLSLT